MMQEYNQELAAIKDLLKKNPKGMSVTDISKALSKNKNTIGRYLDILLISGQVDMRAFGMAKVFTLSQRVPLSAMLSYSRELIMVLDDESRIIDINDNFLKLLHLSREETLGKNLAYLQSPDADVHELLDSVSPEKGNQETVVTFRVKGKGDRIFHQKCIPTVFDDGQKGITLLLDDVTEHILADRKIRESEERFRMMADNIRDGLMIMEDGKIIYANTRIADITGYSYEELWAMDPLAIVAPESYEYAAERIREIEASPEKPGEFQMWIIRKDITRRYAYVRISGVAHHGKYLNFIIVTDITDLKCQKDRVLESEERFRMMADNIQDGLIIVENDKIVFSNRRIKEISGYSMEELSGMGLRGMFLRDDSRTVSECGLLPVTEKERLDEIFKTVHAGSPKDGEFKVWISRKDGERRYIHGKITAAKNGEITSFYITLSDITDFADRERILRERIDALQDLLH